MIFKLYFKIIDKFFSLKPGSYIYKIKILIYKNRFLNFGNKNVIYFPIKIEYPEGVSIGNNVSINSYVHIWGTGGVKIGNNVMIASHACITSATHDYNKEDMIKVQVLRNVEIQDNVWIGTGAIIMPGVIIGEGSVVGAGSVVTKNVPSRSIVIGSPAKVIKYRNIES
jgi:maltose O-acetyltransferase